MLRRSYTAKPPLGALINRGHPLAQRLVGYWLFNEGGGLYTFDSSGRNNKGTLTNGPLWVPGRIGPVLYFDGVDDYVNVTAPHFSASSLTISAWIKRNGTQSSWSGIVFSRGGFLPATGFCFGTGHELRYTWKNDPATYGFDSGLVVPDNTWSFVVMVVEPTKATLYLNNNSAVNTLAHLAIDDWDSDIRIGDDSYGTRYFKGLIDDVRIYNRVLRPEEIQWLYTDPYAMFEQPRRGKWFYVEAGGLSISIIETLAFAEALD